jgi:hypothetical protein
MESSIIDIPILINNLPLLTSTKLHTGTESRSEGLLYAVTHLFEGTLGTVQGVPERIWAIALALIAAISERSSLRALSILQAISFERLDSGFCQKV